MVFQLPITSGGRQSNGHEPSSNSAAVAALAAAATADTPTKTSFRLEEIIDTDCSTEQDPSFRSSVYSYERFSGKPSDPSPYSSSANMFRRLGRGSSQYNVAHFNNPAFQPEEWRPDIGAYKRRRYF